MEDQLNSFGDAYRGNSKVLPDLDGYLAHLSGPTKADIMKRIKDTADILSGIPYRATVLKHDIDVDNHKQIKKHAYVLPINHATSGSTAPLSWFCNSN